MQYLMLRSKVRGGNTWAGIHWGTITSFKTQYICTCPNIQCLKFAQVDWSGFEAFQWLGDGRIPSWLEHITSFQQLLSQPGYDFNDCDTKSTISQCQNFIEHHSTYISGVVYWLYSVVSGCGEAQLFRPNTEQRNHSWLPLPLTILCCISADTFCTVAGSFTYIVSLIF